jgi:NifU-like protein involved in Fe-S cluster formation
MTEGHHPVDFMASAVTFEGVSGSPGDGPYIILRLRLVGERIAGVEADSNGCPAAMTCAGLTARLVSQRSIEEAKRLEAADLLLLLRDFEGPKERYAPMAVEALSNALSQIP